MVTLSDVLPSYALHTNFSADIADRWKDQWNNAHIGQPNTA